MAHTIKTLVMTVLWIKSQFTHIYDHNLDRPSLDVGHFQIYKKICVKNMSYKMYVIKNVTKCQSLGSNWYRYGFINDRFCIISDQILFCIFCAHTFAQNKVVFKISLFGIIAVTLVVISENKTTTIKKQQKYQHFISLYLVWFSKGKSHYNAICLKLRYFLFRCHNSHWRLLMLLLFFFVDSSVVE